MLRAALGVLAVIGVVGAATADDKPAPPRKGGVPIVAVARATEKDGAVVVHLSTPVEVPDGADPVAGPDRAPVIGARSKMGWFDRDVVADGRTVRAFTADGKAIDPKDLPKRLAKASRVVLFQGQTDPDPYYLGLYREDVVLLVAAPAHTFSVP
ncbi:MAG TPA: hypothetical protein VGF55_01360 [Gemmataceae bacterium]|jgi:hypothetical protein